MYICTFWSYKCYISGCSETILSVRENEEFILKCVLWGLISNS